jgi:hypothetical protein
MAKYRVDDKVRVKQDAQSPPPPSYVRDRSAVVVKVHPCSGITAFVPPNEHIPSPVQYYRIRIELLPDHPPHQQPEHDIGEDWLEPE